MFQSWRLKLREAEEAYKGGRLDEASRLLCQADLREFLPARRLLQQVAIGLAQRSRERAARGESQAGWRDLDQASLLGADAQLVGDLRQEFVDEALKEIERFLLAGDAAMALDRSSDLLRRQATHREARVLKQVAQKVDSAQKAARAGRFGDAEQDLEAAAALRPDLKRLAEWLDDCRSKAAEHRRLTERLHKALEGTDWTLALTVADQVLEICPESEPARDARRRAWAAVGAKVADPARRARPIAAVSFAVDTAPKIKAVTPVTRSSALPKAGRYCLWVDEVGGFLVCEGNEIVLGQPISGGDVDVPILGDLSRRHALIRRDGGDYLFEPIRDCKLNGRTVQGAVPLNNGSVLELGEGVRMRFLRPHPFSTTARLEITSGHRTLPTVDAVLLMGETCILGPEANCHVVCRNWPRKAVLFRHNQELCFRTEGSFTVDGTACTGRAVITPSSHLAGDGFSLTLETV
jgi:hypothetical protein